MQPPITELELIATMFQAHPWHGVTPPFERGTTAFIEIVPADVVKYELDKASGQCGSISEDGAPLRSIDFRAPRTSRREGVALAGVSAVEAAFTMVPQRTAAVSSSASFALGDSHVETNPMHRRRCASAFVQAEVLAATPDGKASTLRH